MELEYEVPRMPPHCLLLGDIHSHADGPAYASSLDQSDEAHRPGLHFVVGHILDEPPQFHCDVIADGLRFHVSDLALVMEGYQRRRVDAVPPEWLDQVSIKPWSSHLRGESRGLNSSWDTPGSSSGAAGGARSGRLASSQTGEAQALTGEAGEPPGPPPIPPRPGAQGGAALPLSSSTDPTPLP